MRCGGVIEWTAVLYRMSFVAVTPGQKSCGHSWTKT